MTDTKKALCSIFLGLFVVFSIFNVGTGQVAASGTGGINSYFNTAKATLESYLGQAQGWNPTIKVVPGDTIKVQGNTLVVGANLFIENYNGIPGGKGYYYVAEQLVEMYLNYTVGKEIPGSNPSSLSVIWNLDLRNGKIVETPILSNAIAIAMMKTLLPQYDGINLKKLAMAQEEKLLQNYSEIGKDSLVEWTFKLVSNRTTIHGVIKKLRDIANSIPNRNFGYIVDMYGAPYRTAVLIAAVESVNPQLASSFPVYIPPNVLSTAKKAIKTGDFQPLIARATKTHPIIPVVNYYPIWNLEMTIEGQNYTVPNGNLAVVEYNPTRKSYIVGPYINNELPILLKVTYVNSTSMRIKVLQYNFSAGAILRTNTKTILLTSESKGKTFITSLAGYPWDFQYLSLKWTKGGQISYEIEFNNGSYIINWEKVVSNWISSQTIPYHLKIQPLSNDLYLITPGKNSGYVLGFGNVSLNVTDEATGKTFIASPESGVTVRYKRMMAGKINSSIWSFVGSAYYDSKLNAIVLTPNQKSQAGAAWFKTPIPLNKPFKAVVQFYAGNCGENNGDGFWVGFQAKGLNAVGANGQGLGIGPNPYDNVPPVSPASGFGLWEYKKLVEFYVNGQFSTIANNVCFADGKEHTLVFSWNPKNQTLSITIDGKYTYTKQINLIQTLKTNQAYFGLTAGTGGASNLHYFKPIIIGRYSYILPIIKSTREYLINLSKAGVKVADLMSELNNLENQLTSANQQNSKELLKIYNEIQRIQEEATIRAVTQMSNRYSQVDMAMKYNLTSIAVSVSMKAAKVAMMNGNITQAISYVNQAYNATITLAKEKIQNVLTNVEKLMKKAQKLNITTSNYTKMVQQAKALENTGDYIQAYLTARKAETHLQQAINEAEMKKMKQKWSFVGSAYYNSNAIVLTPNQGSQAGAAWFKIPIPLNKPFKAIIQFYTGNSGGGDGIWIGFQAQGLNAIGGTGSNLGINGVSPAVGFGIENFWKCVEFYVNGQFNTIANGVCFADGKEHTLVFSWNPETQILRITIDGTTTYSKQINLIQTLKTNQAYFGLTAGTGGLSNLHYFRIVNLTKSSSSSSTSTTSTTSSSHSQSSSTTSSTTTSSSSSSTSSSSISSSSHSQSSTTQQNNNQQTSQTTTTTPTEVTSSTSNTNTQSSTSSTQAKHPLKVGDWFKYKITFKATSGSQKASGTVYVTYKVINVTDQGFIMKVESVSGDIQTLVGIFGNETDLEKGATFEIPWDNNPETNDSAYVEYANPAILPKDGKLAMGGGGLAIAHYNTKTGILEKLTASAEAFGVKYSITEELVSSHFTKSHGSHASKSHKSICGPAFIVVLALLPLLIFRRRR